MCLFDVSGTELMKNTLTKNAFILLIDMPEIELMKVIKMSKMKRIYYILHCTLEPD